MTNLTEDKPYTKLKADHRLMAKQLGYRKIKRSKLRFHTALWLRSYSRSMLVYISLLFGLAIFSINEILLRGATTSPNTLASIVTISVIFSVLWCVTNSEN